MSGTRAARVACTIAVVWLVAAAPAQLHAAVSGADVKRAVARGVEALKKRQLPDGTWTERYYEGGTTALATLALLTAGESPDSPAVAAGLARVRDLGNQHTYVVALKIMVLARADPRANRDSIRAAAEWLIAAQNRSGLWNYTADGDRFDHSNAQFALLGLHTAAEAGVPVPQQVWNRAQEAVFKSQLRDGGWAYQIGGKSYGSMTAACVADLLILGQTLQVGREREFRSGLAPGCGEYRTNRSLALGLTWLGRNFTARENPGRGADPFLYWLYASERCGILSGQRFFGRHDWYREGAEYLVSVQPAGGLWQTDVVATSFALLFLAKGHRSLLLQKLQWSDDTDWNLDRSDAEHLVDFIGERFGAPTTWQAIRFDAPLEEWLAAPLLYMQGHAFPHFSDAQRGKLRKYIEAGGTLLAEACCGRDEFRTGFEDFCKRTFPEAPLRELGAEHPVYHTEFELGPAGLMGVDLGCRTSVLFAPNDLSCLWEQARVPKLSEHAFRLGTNICAYAIGRAPLRDRLDVVVIPKESAPADATPPGDVLRLTQVVYDGDWRTDAGAMAKLAEFLRDELAIDVVTAVRTARLTDRDLQLSPVLYMTGHFAFELAPAEQAALAAHLRRGGFLFVDACCGREPFDTALRAMVRSAFPDAKLERLPADHPIVRGSPGFDLRTVHYKPRAAAAADGSTAGEPELWALTLGGRVVLVYSPAALGCGIDGHVCYDCRGLVEDDARRLAGNIVLYALTH